MSILENVKEAIINAIGSANVLTPDTVVLNTDAIDDDTARDIIMSVEEMLKVTILDKDAEKLKTVKDIVDYVTEVLKPKTKKDNTPKK